MSEPTLRRLSELALIGIASIWGLTFVMVQDAIRELPTMAFLAYRFIPPAQEALTMRWLSLAILLFALPAAAQEWSRFRGSAGAGGRRGVRRGIGNKITPPLRGATGRGPTSGGRPDGLP